MCTMQQETGNLGRGTQALYAPDRCNWMRMAVCVLGGALVSARIAACEVPDVIIMGITSTSLQVATLLREL